MAATKASVWAEQSRGVDDAVNGRPFTPKGSEQEQRAYTQRYVDYFGADIERAYRHLDHLDGKRALDGRAYPAVEFEQLPLFGGA